MVTDTLAAAEAWWPPWYHSFESAALGTCRTCQQLVQALVPKSCCCWRRSLGADVLGTWKTFTYRELNFCLSGPRYYWYFPLVCQGCCCLQDQIRFFLLVHIHLLYHQKTQDKILEAGSLKLALLAAQISSVHGKGMERLVLRQLSSPIVKNISASESGLFWASV